MLKEEPLLHPGAFEWDGCMRQSYGELQYEQALSELGDSVGEVCMVCGSTAGGALLKSAPSTVRCIPCQIEHEMFLAGDPEWQR